MSVNDCELNCSIANIYTFYPNNAFLFHKKYIVGITNNESNGAVIIPPTIGAAILCITSEPVP